MQLPRCKSFNFCTNRQTCELNSADFHQSAFNRSISIKSVDILKDVIGCVYVAMSKLVQPVCYEKGLFKNIQDDNNPGKCAINLKRTDAQWTEWRENEHVIRGPYSGVHLLRDCIGNGHGGKIECPGGLRSDTIYYVPSERLKRDGAYTFCKVHFSQNFHLFFGQGDQFLLKLVAENLNPETAFWVGVKYSIPENTWVDMHGNNVSGIIPWYEDEPNGGATEPFASAMARYNGVFCHDLSANYQLQFACESWN